MKSFIDKFAVGRIFAIPADGANIAHKGLGTPDGFRTVINPPAIHLGHSKGKIGFSDRISGFKDGVSGDSHRNFRWLPYIPAYVSEIEQGNLPVLTGPLSGCPVTRYVRGVTTYVAHVGTVDEPTDQRTIDAKRRWNRFARNVAVGALTGCNVARDLLGEIGNVSPTRTGDGAIKFWAIAMPNGDFYGFAAYSQYDHQDKRRPFPVPVGGVGGTAWWRVALAPVLIENSVWPINGIMT
jgi:hypothetical protein